MKEEPNAKSKNAIREEEILKFWQENKIFDKSLEKEAPKGEFVFYDGPPFATGEPHYGHLLAGTMKDVIPRYKTMDGYHVRRIWGWDCHGLPIENLIEKELNLGNKKDIEKYGIAKFNQAARAIVLRYEDLWKKFIPRSGRWVDMDKPYKTMDSSYTESVWWGFKTLSDKNLIYEGFKVMPYCPHCGTSLSNFEVNQGYKDISDISVYVKFKIKGFPNAYFLAWTTTPWTLPGNVALAVGKDIEYVEVKMKDEILVLAKDRVSVIAGDYEIVATHKGSEMVGMEYEPVFDLYAKDHSLKNRENGWKVYVGDFVTTEEGTGIVHIAPAFGDDDMKLGIENNLPFVQHVDTEGKMKEEVAGFGGRPVKPKSDDERERISTDIEIIKYLQEKGGYFDKKKITHSYPHCWRCDTPLLNYATSSWFVKVTDLKSRMSELNNKINWVPSTIGENRFGKWLEGARDWAISRSRFWGAPLPVWTNEKGEKRVVGSIDELKKLAKKSGNKYFVMRHGESERNAKDVLNHYMENVYHLTKDGTDMVKSKVNELKNKKIDLIITSPFHRCVETGEIIRDALDLPQDRVSTDERLWELRKGLDFEGKSLEEYHEFFSNTKERFEKAPHGGETLIDIKKRVGDFLYDLENKYKDKNILIVSHKATLRSLHTVGYGLTLEQDIVAKERDDYAYDVADIGDLDFTPIPHNHEYELDLHKPFIDDVELVDENGGKLTRVKEVFDTWFDSGSMPYASVHYPFENKEDFDKKENQFFPADFIAEGLDQTRGWFYTLLVLGTGIFDRSPYNNVIVNGIVLAEDGQKMSKRLKNYPDPSYVLDKYGADSMRYYLLSSPAMRAEDLAFSEKGLDEVNKKIFLRLDNILSFYKLYSGTGDETANTKFESQNVLDKWLVSRLNDMGKEIRESLDSYELDKASRPILNFVDDFSTWYVRRSRDRFKSDDVEDKKRALATTRFVLIELAKYMAPFTPFFSEYLYGELKSDSDPESVHLCSFPIVGEVEVDVLNTMQVVRDVVTLALEKRNDAGIKVRQPLNKIILWSHEDILKADYLELIKDEINIKEVLFDKDQKEKISLDTDITPELKTEGEVRELIRAIQELRKEGNLTPDQKIVLQVETSEEGQRFVEENKVDISKPTNITGFEFVPNSGSELKIGEISLKISL